MALSFFRRSPSRIDELKKVLSKDPASRQFLVLADEYRKEGKLREAIETLERGLSYNPGSVAGHVGLGRLLLVAGRLDDALLSFQAALRLDRENLVATRQIAEIFLKKGDKVEGVKKLKLYRGLNPGDKEVSELITRLDAEIGFGQPKPPVPPPRPAAQEPPPTVILHRGGVPTPQAPVPRFAPPPDFRGHAYPEASGVGLGLPPADAAVTAPVPSLPLPPAPPEGPLVAPAHADSAAPALRPPPLPPPPPPAPVEPPPGRRPAAAPEVFELTYDSTGRSRRVPEAPAAAPPAEAVPVTPVQAAVPGDLLAGTSLLELERTEPQEAPDATVILAPAPPPAETETLADLYAAQGHLVDARRAYARLAEAETDAVRAHRLREKIDAVAARLEVRTPAERLRRWGEAVSGVEPEAAPDLDQALGEVVERLPGATAAVTDFEGLAVVSRGPEVGSAALEGVSAELTALWKNVRRTQREHGEGALEALVVTTAQGTVVVQGITSSYALLLKADSSSPLGRVRFEALRGAERLRPALL